MKRLVGLLLVVLASCGREPPLPAVSIAFVDEGRSLPSLDLAALARGIPPEAVRTEDPYYRAPKRFRALPLEPVLTRAFGVGVEALRARSFLLVAADGYTVPIEGRVLLEGGAYLAFDDVDVPGFAPIGPRQVSPAPLYLVWTRPGQSDLATHPRPYQLVRVELARFEATHPHTVPTGASPDDPATRGFALFRQRCVRCHAINREGGRVGPDLNVPRSVTEYRDEATLRAFIRDPRAFRYGAMPSHHDLSEGDLDALLAYLRHMAGLKFDPHAPEDAAE